MTGATPGTPACRSQFQKHRPSRRAHASQIPSLWPPQRKGTAACRVFLWGSGSEPSAFSALAPLCISTLPLPSPFSQDSYSLFSASSFTLLQPRTWADLPICKILSEQSQHR